MEDQRTARDAAIARVEAHSPVWRSFAILALKDVAVTKRTLTSDDVWKMLRRRGVPEPVEPRAMGPVMLHGIHEEWLESTDQIRISDDSATANHNRPQRVYMSRIFGGKLTDWKDGSANAVVVDGIVQYFDVQPLRAEAAPPPPPTDGFKYTSKPTKVDFGAAVVCPRCKGLIRTVKGRKLGYTSEPHKVKDSCIRCGGYGVVPNVGPVP